MTEQTFIYSERNNKENLLDKGQPYNSLDLDNKTQNSIPQIFQQPNYTPHDLNDPMIQHLYPQSEDFDQKVLPLNIIILLKLKLLEI